MIEPVRADLDRRAREILRTNDKGGYTVPTDGLYPYQWNWDSVFVALGFATFDESRACREIETLFEVQWDSGFVPHIVFRQDDPGYFPGPSTWNAGGQVPTSGITQPPIAASVIYEMWCRTKTDSIRERLATLFPKVLAWHRWFHRCRISEDTGAVIITHPWESGRDNSPEWTRPTSRVDPTGVGPYQRRDLQHADASMRPLKRDYDRYIALLEYGRDTGWDHSKIATEGPFRMADVGMTMILLRATRDLIRLSKELGRVDIIAELDGYVRSLEQGADYLWDSKAQTYCSRDVISGEASGYVTNASFLYGYAGVGDHGQQAHMARHWDRIGARVQYMLPSQDPDDAGFDHMRYWCGPVWIMMNYILARGFLEIGQQAWAERLRADSHRLIADFGFHEAFSPQTGDGTGGRDFSWTAAMWLAWCGRNTAAPGT